MTCPHREEQFRLAWRSRCSTAFTLLLALPMAGCGSLIGNLNYAELERDVESRVYIGTKIDATFLAAPFRSGPGDEAHQSFALSLLLWPFALLDLPLSFALDTVLLPYTLTAGKKSGGGS